MDTMCIHSKMILNEKIDCDVNNYKPVISKECDYEIVTGLIRKVLNEIDHRRRIHEW